MKFIEFTLKSDRNKYITHFYHITGNRQLMQCNEIFKSLLEDYGRHGCIEEAEKFPPIYKRKK